MIAIRFVRRVSTLSISSISFNAGLFALVIGSAAAFGQAAADRFAGLTPRPVGPIQLHGTIGYVAPAGWTVKNGPEGVTILTGPVPDNERPCEIWMLPPIPLQGEMADQGGMFVQSLGLTKQAGSYHDDRRRYLTP